MDWILVILTLVNGEPLMEAMRFDTSAECYQHQSWVRSVDARAKVVCFDVAEVKNEE